MTREDPANEEDKSIAGIVGAFIRVQDLREPRAVDKRMALPAEFNDVSRHLTIP